jgi:hypothetical protein
VQYISSIAANLMDAMDMLSPGMSRLAAKPSPRLSYAAPDTSCTELLTEHTFLRSWSPQVRMPLSASDMAHAAADHRCA